MLFGFQSRICETVTAGDFHYFKLLKPIEFFDTDGTLYKMPEGAPTDLASVPREFWDELPPFGEYALEAYVHDGAYQNWLLKWNGSAWVKAALSFDQSNDLFKRAMDMNPNITEVQKIILYKAVVTFGGHSFKEDRS